MFDISKYSIKNVNTDVCLPSDGVNVVVIETDQYAGNFDQDICFAVFGCDFFGFDYSPSVRSQNMSADYERKLTDLGYAPRYFMSLSKECRHEEYGNIIADIMLTPVVSPEEQMEFKSVALFFKASLSQPDMETIEKLVREYMSDKKVNILGIGQFMISIH